MRRYEYQQRKSASNVSERKHRKRSQSQPIATKTSEIIANASVQRTTHPKDNRVCVFQYTPRTRPVEPRFCGVIVPLHRQNWDPTKYPWYLNVRRLLHLNRVSVENSIAYMTTHCYRTEQRSHMYEFGRHVYANRDGYLYMIEMWKAFRRNDTLFYSDEQTINDVLPKLRWSDDRDGYVTLNTLSVSCKKATFETYWLEIRWWYKYGREDDSRFFEWQSIKAFETMGTAERPVFRGTAQSSSIMIVKTRPHFGVYVDNKAKLILRDTISTRHVSHDYNHTLVQSGVFIAVQGECRVTFMDNTQKVYSLSELRIGSAHNPIIVVSAVPSIGESLCWGLTIGAEVSASASNPTVSWPNLEDSVIGVSAILNVPLLGMNNRRIRIYDWEEGFQHVKKCQRDFDYEQFVGIDSHPNLSVSEHDVRSAQFIPNEQLEYPRI